MTTPPRHLVLSEAEKIIDRGLAGDTDDRVLATLAHFRRFSESFETGTAKVRAAWEKAKLSPFFKLYCAYLGIMVLAYLFQWLGERAKKRQQK